MQSEREDILKTKYGSHIAYVTYEDCLILEKYLKRIRNFEYVNANMNKVNVYKEKEECKQEEIIKENSEKYAVKTKTLPENAKITYNKHDKLFKDLFSNKEETAKFINKYLELIEEINVNGLEKYTNSYITKMYENKEADIVYKLKNKDIFFLIEHQSTVDRTMPNRILNYVNAIRNDAIDKKKIRKKGYKYPQVIPIVLYTGKNKWDIPINIAEIQQNLLVHNETVNIYNLIDINVCEDVELLNDNLLISKAMLIEKGRNKEEVVSNFKMVIEKLKELKIAGGEHLINVVLNYIVNGVLDTKDKEEIEKILKKEGENIMLNCVKVINEENARLVKQGRIKGRAEGRTEGKNIRQIEIIINMLKNKFTDEQIKMVTGIGDKELEEIKMNQI